MKATAASGASRTTPSSRPRSSRYRWTNWMIRRRATSSDVRKNFAAVVDAVIDERMGQRRATVSDHRAHPAHHPDRDRLLQSVAYGQPSTHAPHREPVSREVADAEVAHRVELGILRIRREILQPEPHRLYQRRTGHRRVGVTRRCRVGCSARCLRRRIERRARAGARRVPIARHASRVLHPGTSQRERTSASMPGCRSA